MASSVSTALAIRLRQARKQLLKDQQQHPQTVKQQLKPPPHHHYQQHLHHQQQRRPSNQPNVRKTSQTLTGTTPAFDSAKQLICIT